MKTSRFFRTCILSGILLGLAISSFAQESPKDLRSRLDEEFRWLREEAMEVVTVATKTKMKIDEAPSIVSVITQEQIKNSGAKNLKEALGQVAGFYLYDRSTYPDIIASIRGISSSGNASVKLMINGHSTETPSNQNFGWLIGFPVELIRKIEIIRGPGAALYGSSAMNGVINIITEDADDPSAVSAAYGSFDTYRGTPQLSHSAKNFRLFLFADHISSDGDPQMIGKDYASAVFPPGYSFAPGYTNEDFRYDTFFTKLSYNDIRLTGFFKFSNNEPLIGIQNALTDENDVSDKNAFIEAGYEKMVSDKISLSAKAYYDYNMYSPFYEGFDQKTSALFGFPSGESMVGEAESKSGKIGSELMMNAKLPNNAEITAGFLFEYMRGYDIRQIANANPTGKPIVLNGVTYMPMQYLGGMRDISDSYNWMDDDKLKRTVYAGYIQGTWDITEVFSPLKRIGKNLTLTTGLRYDNYDDVGDSLNPRIGLVYAPNDRLFFKLLYGQAFRAPGFNEMYTENNPAIIGNPNLKSETIKTVELQTGVNMTEQITASLNFFHIRKENTIRLYQNAYTNWGEIESQGMEGEVRASFDRHRYAYFNMTFQKAKDITHETAVSGGTAYTQEDFDLGAYPEVMANLGINSEIGKYIKANIWVSYIGSIGRIGKMQIASDGTVEKADSRDPIDRYALTNISLIFRNFDFAKGWEFQITGYNIFNANQTDPEPDGALPNDLPRWGRQFMGKITYTF